MKNNALHPGLLFLNVFFALLLFGISPANAIDGKKWDGKAYPFKSLDPTQANSESNPFIIDTAGKLAYFSKLAIADFDMAAFGEKNGLKGLNFAFSANFVKLTTDLDMNGSLYEFISIPSTAATFDGGGHVITNLRISDRTTKPFIDEDTGDAEIRLALFQDGGIIRNLGIGKGSSITYSNVGNVYKNKKLTLYVYAAAIAIEADEIDGCFSDATITVKGNGDAKVGGIAAMCAYKITNSYNRGAIVFEGNVINSRAKNNQGITTPGTLMVAGVCAEPANRVGAMQKHAGILGCYNAGSITVKASGDEVRIGGVAALVQNCECIDIYNTGKVSLSATGDIKKANIGGVLGSGATSPALIGRPIQYIDPGKNYNSGNINVSLKTGSKICVGGISGGEVKDKPGFDGSSSTFGGVYGFINTYNTGSISVLSTEKVDALNVGGIVGFGCMVFNSYNTGNISVDSGAGTNIYSGGIGGNSVYAQNCYNIGSLTSKGTGTNLVGGILGLANVLWGENENGRSSVMNVFWLKQPQTGGINSDINYGKGSYYYKPDEGESSLFSIVESLAKKKKNASPESTSAPTPKASNGKMVEDIHLGATYVFEVSTATVLARSDDEPGKRKAYEGSLLQALNEMAEQKSDRNYRKWEIDESNGGYPVFK